MIHALLQSMPPFLGEFVLPFLIMGLGISLVTAGMRKDEPVQILLEALRVFVVLVIGFAVFAVALFLLGDPHMFF
ncbi:MAG: hypothetical protein AB7K09_20490 [Planctomycetota bacterium]